MTTKKLTNKKAKTCIKSYTYFGTSDSNHFTPSANETRSWWSSLRCWRDWQPGPAADWCLRDPVATSQPNNCSKCPWVYGPSWKVTYPKPYLTSISRLLQLAFWWPWIPLFVLALHYILHYAIIDNSSSNDHGSRAPCIGDGCPWPWWTLCHADESWRMQSPNYNIDSLHCWQRRVNMPYLLALITINPIMLCKLNVFLLTVLNM